MLEKALSACAALVSNIGYFFAVSVGKNKVLYFKRDAPRAGVPTITVYLKSADFFVFIDIAYLTQFWATGCSDFLRT